MNCWLCGAEGRVAGHIMSGHSPVPIRTLYNWPAPADDHEHAVRPPTPQELADAGYRVWTRIMSEVA